MNTCVYLFLFFFLFQENSFCQYLKFDKASNGTNAISVPSNEYWQVVSFSTLLPGYDDVGRIYSSTNQTTQNLIGTIPEIRGSVYGMESGPGGGSGSIFAGAVIPGPAFIFLYPEVVSYHFLFKKILGNADTLIGKTAVVIPENALGEVAIKVEQSSDSINWVEALPGLYNTSTMPRFFRVRAIENP